MSAFRSAALRYVSGGLRHGSTQPLLIKLIISSPRRSAALRVATCVVVGRLTRKNRVQLSCCGAALRRSSRRVSNRFIKNPFRFPPLLRRCSAICGAAQRRSGQAEATDMVGALAEGARGFRTAMRSDTMTDIVCGAAGGGRSVCVVDCVSLTTTTRVRSLSGRLRRLQWWNVLK